MPDIFFTCKKSIYLKKFKNSSISIILFIKSQTIPIYD